MKVFKFGGASVKDAEAVRNIVSILKQYENEDLYVVISAMGKTTNALESLAKAFFDKSNKVEALLNEIKAFHLNILNELFIEVSHPIFEEIENAFVEIEWQLEDDAVGTFDFEYDQMVGIGEILSTKIVSAYLNYKMVENDWVDVRGLIRTNNNYRNAQIEWEETQRLISNYDSRRNKSITITQGFIGSSSENFTTTLGREGSDYTAAIIASALKAEEVIIWKDVDGMRNADPKFFKSTIKLNNISYLEAVELAYYGASVIHPKTVKPLQNANIPLKVKSFIHADTKGTLINHNTSDDSLIPSFIHKGNQRLISISSNSFDFITEGGLSHIYALFSKLGVKINVMQNSAISFSVCVDDTGLVDQLIRSLQKDYKVTFNQGLTLYTIRHYSEEVIADLLKGKTIYLEQKSRSTARFVVK